ncbi:MAG: MmgE/PrpD family protein [Pseudomonadota bacterium]
MPEDMHRDARPMDPIAFTVAPTAELIDGTRARQAALLLLDTLGVMIAAHPMEAGVIARRASTRLYGATDPDDQAALPLDGRLCSRAGVAFALATQTDNLDAHDGYNPTKGHIGCAVVPALLAEAQGRDLSGQDALAALIASYEIAGRAGIALHASVQDYHTSGAWNALGVVALAARLRGLGADQLRHAYGIAEYHGPRSQMMREIANPTMLHDGSGMGAMVGLSAVLLAEEGFTGAPAITMEAPEAAPHWQDLGRFWQIGEQYIKPYPICRWAHAAVDATREVMAAHALVADDIAGLEVRSFRNAVALFGSMPATTSQAQYSLGFAVAQMAVYGKIGVPQISGAGLSDRHVAAFLARITLREDPRFESRYPTGRWAEVEITLQDGQLLNSGEVHARGGPERPFTRQETREKFMAFTAPVIGEDRASAIWAAGLSLSDPSVAFTALTDLLTAPP